MTRRIGLIALAIVLALAGTLAVFAYTHNADKRAVAGVRSVPVLIAQKTIPAGTSWKEAGKDGYLAEERLPAISAPSRAVASLSADIPADEVTTGQIAAGQVVVRQMFAQPAAAVGILPIPKEKLALSVSMSDAADVAGFVRPNSEVAIFVTAKLSKPPATLDKGALGGADLYVTKLLIPRVSVLATSQVAPSDLGKGTGSTSGNKAVLLTLAVSQHEAQQIILAQQTAQLYLGLLSDTSKTAPDVGVLNVGTFDPAPIFVN